MGQILKFLPAFNGAGERHIVGVFKLGAERQAAGEAGNPDAQRRYQVAEIHGGLFPFKIGVGGQYNFLDHAVLQTVHQLSHPDIVRADAFGGRDGAVQHVVHTAVNTGMLQRQYILRLLYNTYQAAVALVAATE